MSPMRCQIKARFSSIREPLFMKSFVIAIILVSGGMSLAASAADTSCADQAAQKKLSGAAKTSFTKKCLQDSKATAADQCAAQAADKKLYGAAKNSFVKKCVTDASK
jgi:hypothetical protein